MSLEKTISSEIMAAMKARDAVRLSALRNIKKYIIEAKTSGAAVDELPDADVIKIITKLAKQGTDSAAIYTQQNRADLAGGGAGTGQGHAGVPAQAADTRGTYGRGQGHHRRDGSRIDEGYGTCDGRCY